MLRNRIFLVIVVALLAVSVASAATPRYLVFGRNPVVPGGITQAGPGEEIRALPNDTWLTMRGASNEVVSGIAQAGTLIVWRPEGDLMVAKAVQSCGNPVLNRVIYPVITQVVQAPPQIVERVVERVVEKPVIREIIVERRVYYPQYVYPAMPPCQLEIPHSTTYIYVQRGILPSLLGIGAAYAGRSRISITATGGMANSSAAASSSSSSSTTNTTNVDVNQQQQMEQQVNISGAPVDP